MRTFYPTILLLLSSLAASAQITLETGDAPAIGDQFVIGVDTLVMDYNVGDGGADQVWDFSDIMPQTYNTVNVISPENAPGGAAFPEATFAIGTDTVVFAQLIDDAVNYLGLAVDFLGTGEAVAAKYDPPFKYLEIPTTIQTARLYGFVYFTGAVVLSSARRFGPG